MKTTLSMIALALVFGCVACNTKAKKLKEELTKAKENYANECNAYQSQLASINQERETANQNLTSLGGNASSYSSIFARHDSLILSLENEISLYCVGDDTANTLLTEFEKDENWEKTNASFVELKENMSKRTGNISDMISEHQSIMLSKKQLFSAFVVSGK